MLNADVAADFLFKSFDTKPRSHFICLPNVKKLSDKMSSFVFRGRISNTKVSSFALELFTDSRAALHIPFLKNINISQRCQINSADAEVFKYLVESIIVEPGLPSRFAYICFSL